MLYMLTYPNWWSGAQKCSLLPFATWKDIASECTKLLFYEKTEETRQGLQKHGCYCRRMNWGISEMEACRGSPTVRVQYKS